MNQPNPEFVQNLERELQSTIRRQEEFSNHSPIQTIKIRKLGWKISLVALAAMCIGSAATYAVTQRMRSQTADLIVARSEAHMELANARHEFFLEELRDAQSRFEQGLIPHEQVDALQFELAQLEANAATCGLDIEEAQITGHDPNNALSAPKVRGRDFVTERLEIQKGLLLDRISFMETMASQSGMDENQLSAFTQEIHRINIFVSAIEQRISLRQEYHSGARTARQVELADMQSSVKPQLEMATIHLNETQKLLDRYQNLFDQGSISRTEVRAVEMEFRAAELQLKLANLEMQILENKLADPTGK